MRAIRQSFAILLLLALLPALAACGQRTEEPASAEGPRGKVYYTYFDTVSYVYDYAGDSAERFDDRSAEVSHILMEYHQLFDIYHEYAGLNNLCSLNKAAGGEAISLDPRLIDFLLCARELYDTTGGEMNVMLGAVLRLWHEAREAASADPDGAAIPTAEALSAAAGHTDITLLEIDPEKNTARIADPLASIDVGAFGKGYAVERAAEWLQADGAEGYVLNVGGNIRCIGFKPDGTSWVTAVRNPDAAAEDYALRIKIADISCVTSGVYERFFTVDGVRYHHIIDKDTLLPAAYYDSLTVLTADSGLADALSTALFCIPFEESLRLAESLEGVEALWIFPDGEQRSTPGFADYIQKNEE